MAEQRVKTTELARLSGYSFSAVQRRLSGETVASLEDVDAFARALGLTMTVTFAPAAAAAVAS